MRCQGFDSGSNINVPNSQIESTRSDDKLNCRLNLVINPALDMLMNIMVQNCNFYDLTYTNHEDFPSICTGNLFQLHAQFNSSNLPADCSCGYFFSPAVVWNPWEKKSRSMVDLGDEEYKQMLCVDAAAIERSISLKPGEEWTGRMELSAVPSTYCSEHPGGL